MDLVDLIDLEAQLAVDDDVDPESLRERDRGIAAILADPDGPPRVVLRGWLDGLRRRAPGRSLGQRVVRVRGWLGALLVGVGALAGAGAASAALAFDGHHPVNALSYLWLFVGVQLALLALFLLSLLVRRLVPGLGRSVPGFGVASAAVRQLGAWLLRVGDRARRRVEPAAEGGEGLETAAAALRRVRRRAAWYRPVERWSLVAATQAFAVAFNVGALLRFVLLVAFTDIAFAWSTTLTVEPATVHALLEGLATPWAWLVPDAAPTAELIASTRYVRIEGAYLAAVAAGRTGDPLLVGGWWPFLFLATAVYGLLPRLALWGVAHGLRVRALRRVPVDTPDVRRVLRRLRYPRVDTRAATAAAAPAAPPAVEPRRPSAPAEEVSACALVLWRDAPDDPAVHDAAGDRLGWRIAQTLRAGGLDYAQERTAVSALGAAAGEAVLLVAESFEAPDKALLAFLRAVRAAVGPRRPVVVALTGGSGPAGPAPPAPEDVRLWREGLARLADPYLDLEPIGRAA